MSQSPHSELRDDQTPIQGHDSHIPTGNGKPPISGRKAILLVLVLLVVAVILAATGIVPRLRARTTLQQQTDALAAPDVITAKPTMGQPSQEVVLPGNIYAYQDSPLYARTSGYLKKWYFDIGGHVKEGQLLAIIESPEIDQQLMQAKADLATAEANAGNAQIQSKRYQDLLKSNAVSKQDTDTFTTQAASTSTAVKSAFANVQRLEQLVGFEKVYAPFDGTITARDVDTGTLIDAGANKELFHIAAERVLRVYVNVPQIYAHDCVPGLPADLTFDEYPGRRFQGKVVRTSKAIDPVSRTLLVEVDVDNSKGELLPGAYTQVHFKIDNAKPSLIVPVSTLMFRTEGLRISVVQHGDTARLVPITIGRDDGRVVEVVSGLEPQSEVIQNPPDSLIDGEKVHIVKPGAQSAGQPSQAQQGEDK
ncbi:MULTISPECIES: efflux RND transporter periplasmic adaptor subunit [Acidobacteriaceae]|uniref:efflux RND transporter periplasmic adaptor subunit n=1 Tax=Acidobacteriaceae TaxID=204434 RepID=UPI00131E9E6E|nr:MULTISPECIES: efflux RND transporter periplasmic adaptor subunit [Acidobacteriaceae]MDW5267666.1 efflux RND transporter periplasmic adaptor subunit [Edaphobacter sp.]